MLELVSTSDQTASPGDSAAVVVAERTAFMVPAAALMIEHENVASGDASSTLVRICAE